MGMMGGMGMMMMQNGDKEDKPISHIITITMLISLISSCLALPITIKELIKQIGLKYTLISISSIIVLISSAVIIYKIYQRKSKQHGNNEKAGPSGSRQQQNSPMVINLTVNVDPNMDAEKFAQIMQVVERMNPNHPIHEPQSGDENTRQDH
jgi:hypothetical protein